LICGREEFIGGTQIIPLSNLWTKRLTGFLVGSAQEDLVTNYLSEFVHALTHQKMTTLDTTDFRNPMIWKQQEEFKLMQIYCEQQRKLEEEKKRKEVGIRMLIPLLTFGTTES
jgi:hypothetical protein